VGMVPKPSSVLAVQLLGLVGVQAQQTRQLWQEWGRGATGGVIRGSVGQRLKLGWPWSAKHGVGK
ncbi:MAG: hypothetical protein ACPIOQ_07250, partial [Promethearchaeia archaeon]